jgi:hypothetical protein
VIEDLDVRSLDDPAPPVPGASHRTEVARRAGRRLRNRRVALGGSGVAVAVLVVVASVAVAGARTPGGGSHAAATAPVPVTGGRGAGATSGVASPSAQATAGTATGPLLGHAADGLPCTTTGTVPVGVGATGSGAGSGSGGSTGSAGTGGGTVGSGTTSSGTTSSGTAVHPVTPPVVIAPAPGSTRSGSGAGSTGSAPGATGSAPGATTPVPGGGVQPGGPVSVPCTQPPTVAPCPAHATTPSMHGGYCGPAPYPGDGLGPDGVCTGREASAPCGPGVVPGRYYAYSLPVRCSVPVVFDGRRWWPQLTPSATGTAVDVWIALQPDGSAGWIGPEGAEGLTPDTGQPAPACGSAVPVVSPPGAVAVPATAPAGS